MREGVLQVNTPASVLVVDDRPAALVEMTKTLEPLGVHVVTATLGSDIAYALDGQTFAAALLGIYPGGSDPVKTARLLREPVQLRCLPILFLAEADSTDFSLEDAYSLGAVDYLVRPVMPRILRAKVTGFVELFRQAEVARQSMERERINREKSRYLAMLAHELRSPLAPILTSLNLLERAEFQDSSLVEAVWRMGRRIRHLVRLLDDLLDVSLLNSGARELKIERIDMAQIVRVAAEDRRAALEQAGLQLEVETSSVPLWVMGDRIRLVQVIDNLLDNAAKFTESGGRVTVAAEADHAKGVAVIRVLDTGIGLEPEIASHLFDVFSQADNSLDRPRGGLGLGLSVVRGVVERHGGSVTASSPGSGLGTEFLMHLPIEEEPPALSTATEDSPAPVRRRRVLVVEDNKDAATSLSVLLELMGHEVRVAYSGPEAIALAAEWPPEITISDIGLPGFDGFEVARRLRGQLGRGPLIVALTGYGRDEDRRQSHEAGFDHHLVKPADPAVIQRMLATSR
jgi:signal transduction histidine kinase